MRKTTKNQLQFESDAITICPPENFLDKESEATVEIQPQKKRKSFENKNKIILFQKTYIGENKNNNVGLNDFLLKIIETSNYPEYLIFIQDAVKLGVEFEETKNILSRLLELKIEIIFENESLNNFEILHKCSIGKILSMSEIYSILFKSKGIISL